MGLHFKQTVTSGFSNPALAAETAVFTTPVLPATGPSVAPGSEPVNISGTLNITAGTSGTAVTVRIRQGAGVSGALVGGSPVHTVAAGAPQSISFGATDNSGYLQSGAGQYTVTAQVTNGAAASTVNLLDMEVLV